MYGSWVWDTVCYNIAHAFHVFENDMAHACNFSSLVVYFCEELTQWIIVIFNGYLCIIEVVYKFSECNIDSIGFLFQSCQIFLGTCKCSTTHICDW